MRVQFLYDQGSASIPEDGIIFQPPFYYGVTDGVSGVYLPHEGPRLFNERTGGQFASHAISRTFSTASEGQSLENILRKASRMIRQVSEAQGLSLKESEFLPSASFVVASLNQVINILQGGDSLAAWQAKNGTIGATPNLTFAFEEELLRIVAELMEKHGRNRQKMWEEFRPILIDRRRANANTIQGGFAILNGQLEFERFWQKFLLKQEEMALLILFSDGLVPFEWTKDEIAMGKEIISLYQKGGLYSVLELSRAIADEKKSSSHEDAPEATAIAIEF